jgi:uncharacterized coiled-coil protein SlyX
MNEIETNKQTKTIQRINETISCFFKKINKMDRLLVNLTKRQGKKPKSEKSEM